MSDSDRVVILGGHGKIALLAAPKLAAAGFSVDSVIRNSDQAAEVEAADAHPVVLDIETADTDSLAKVFDGAKAVVFSAGAGGGNTDRTIAVDRDAAMRAVDASEQAGVKRFVMVSHAPAGYDIDNLDLSNGFHVYVKAKHEADEYVRQSPLDYTILGPGMLNLDPSPATLTLADSDGNVDGQKPADDTRTTSRELVADVITYVIAHGPGVRETINFYDGAVPLPEALS